NKDDELMAAFLVVFDGLVRRVVQKRWRWNSEFREQYEEEKLISPRNVLPGEKSPSTPRRGSRLFRYHTRYYLRRRAWRYFRRMGFQRKEAYPEAVARALAGYRDAELAKGENILDSW